MANDKRIVVEIVDSTGGEVSKEEAETPSAEVAVESKPQGTRSEAWNIVNYAGDKVLNEVFNEAEYFYGKYTQLTENYVAQNNVREASAIISGASSILSSAAAGAKFGPVGMGVGLLMGVADLGIKTIKNHEEAYEDLDRKAYDKYFQGERLGLIDGNRGTQN